jgi:hypothetical protein
MKIITFVFNAFLDTNDPAFKASLKNFAGYSNRKQSDGDSFGE